MKHIEIVSAFGGGGGTGGSVKGKRPSTRSARGKVTIRQTNPRVRGTAGQKRANRLAKAFNKVVARVAKRRGK